jgi:PAS domain S-box-containing protein
MIERGRYAWLPELRRYRRTGLSGAACRIVVALLLVCLAWPVEAVERGPKGTVRVGIFPFEPFNSIDAQGVAQGLNPDLLRKIVSDGNWQVVFVPGSWAEGLERLQKQEIDLMLSVAYTPERAEIMDFSYESVAELWGQVFVRPEGRSYNISDLAGRRVAVMRRDISGSNFIATAKKLGVQCEIVEYASHADVFAAVQGRRADAGVAPQHFGLRHAGEYQLVGSTILFSPFSIYFASKKGTQHELLSHIDAQLSGWKRDRNSFYYQSLNRWLGNLAPERKIPAWMLYSFVAVVALAVVFSGFVVLLRRTVRRRTGELRESEARYRALVENANSIILRLDSGGRITFFNEYARKFFGYAEEEILGRPAVGTIVPDEEQPGRDMQGMIRDIGSHPHLYAARESENVRRDGSRAWISWTNRPLYGEAGEVVEILCVGNDVTERRTAEEVAREATMKMQEAVRAANVGLWDWDLATDRVHFSAEWKRQIGYEDDEVPDDFAEWQSRVHPDDLASTRARIRQAIAECTPEYQVEFRFRHKDGSYRWILAQSSVLMNDAGEAVRVMGSHIDITERKRAEEELRASEEKHRLLVETISEGIWSMDAGHVTTFVNQAMADMLGYAVDDMLGRQVEDFFFDEDLAFHAERMRRRHQGEDEQYERRFRRKDGSELWTLVSARTLRDDAGRFAGSLAVFTDITEQKRSREAMEKRLVALTQPLDDVEGLGFDELFNPEELQKIQDDFAVAFKVASIITSPDGRPLTRPSNFCTLCSDIIRQTDKGCENCRTSDAVLGRFHPEGPIVQLCLSCGLWDAGASISVGGRHVANWLIGQVRDESQSEAQMLEYAREIGADEQQFIEAFRQVPSMRREDFQRVADLLFTLANKLSDMAYQNVQQARFITEHKRVEEELKESEERFKALHNASFGGITIHDRGLILECNQGLSDISGFSREELIGMNGLLLIAPRSRDMVMENIVAGYEKPYEAVGLRKNGEEYPLRLEARNIPYKGKSVRTVEFRDITELKQEEAKRERLQEQLVQAQKMESVGRLAGGVAHDFNNMLGVIIGRVEMAQESIDPSQQLFMDLDEIRKAAERSVNLTRQLLAFARKQTIAPKVLDFNDAVSGMLRMVRRLIGEDIELAWVPAGNLWKVRMDPSQIDQILANLCINARDAITGVGKVTIQTENVAFDEDHCTNSPDCRPGEYVQLALSDNGCGMDRETLLHIYEPFFTTKEMGKGTGLGLATVYGIVKQNGGFINVYSEPGRGTTFRIYIPRYRETEELPADAGGQGLPVVGGRETILLVEDEPAILAMTATMLERLGYTVLPANTPGEAIDLAKAHGDEISLLLTDVVMPEMNGRDLAGRLQSFCPHLRLLFTSGYTADVIAHHGVLDPGVQFIEKPFTRVDLAEKIREVLSGVGIRP